MVHTVTDSEYAQFKFTQGNLFGSSEFCNYIIDFPADAANGDKIRIQFERLAGAKVLVGIGKEFGQEMQVFSYDNELTILSDKGQYEEVIFTRFPLKAFISIQSKNDCCAEFSFKAIL